MTIRNLEYLFRPRSVALVGASTQPNSIGAVLAHNLIHGGFQGRVMPVHPKHKTVEGVTVSPDVASLPEPPDLAVIATPPDTVPELVGGLAEKGAKAAVVITAGFSEGGREHGLELQQRMLDSARPQLLRIVGPNCLGILMPGQGLNASFSGIDPKPGRLAFVAQSGAIISSVIDWATGRGIGFSHLVSLGDMADVDFGDMLDYLANDAGTRAVLLYVEAVSHVRKFMSAARAAARMKPVIVVKAGRHPEGARAAASHTGAMAGTDKVYDAAFRRAGMLRVLGLEELFAAVENLGTGEPPHGARLGIVTNGGGMGVLATDALIDAGGTLATISPEAMTALDKALPRTWSGGNPIDIIGDADGPRYAAALEALFEDRGVDAILVLHCPTAIASSTEAARAVVDTLATRRPRMPAVFTSWVGESEAQEARRLFAEHRIATHDTPALAVRAFMHLVNYRRNQETLTETPPSIPEEFTPDTERARGIIAGAVADGREWLTEPEAKDVLAAYSIPVAQTWHAETPKDAASRAAAIGGPVALKILSHEITHKSDVGGVALDLPGPQAVEHAAKAMLERVAAAKPEARIEGFSVQPMIVRPGAFELITGIVDDAQFGPTILFGQGGTAVEIVDDTALGLPPLNMQLAREMMARTRIHKLLSGYRGQAAADLDAIALTLIKLSQLVVDLGEVAELDINPLLADAYGVIALDARIRIAPSQAPSEARLAIRPYPKELEEEVPLGSGRTLLLRPVMPEDEPSLQKTFAKLTPEEVRLRFFVPMKTLSHVQAARFSQIDYDREMALVLTEPGIPGTTDIYGVVRITADPDNVSAEYAIVIRSEMTGLGLGVFLMRRIIDYATRRGIGELFGDVLRENTTMLRLCDALGFTRSAIPDEPELVRVTLSLSSEKN